MSCDVPFKGTREAKSASEGDDWYKSFGKWLKKLCACCGKQNESASDQEATRGHRVRAVSSIKRSKVKSVVLRS